MNRYLTNARRATPQGSTGSAAAAIGGPSMFSQLMGGRQPRYNRALDKLQGNAVLFRVPSDFGADEHNVTLGTAPADIAAAATVTFTVNAPRECILRDLIVDELSLAVGAAGSRNAQIIAITCEGNALALGSGSSTSVFASTAFNRPKFDLPVAGGTPLTVTIQNNSAGPLRFAPTFHID
jgi:hypothetical protein